MAHQSTMIGRRNLPTGCTSCGLSLNACAANKSMNHEPCCAACSGHGS